MSETFKQKSDDIVKKISSLPVGEERYSILIKMGRSLPFYPEELKTSDKRVRGCQSILYLHASLKDGKIFFQAASDALISAGLAALLLSVYNEETAQTILTQPPDFLTKLQIQASLSPNRSNGLVQIHLRMKQLALSFLLHS
jgi:cysteine desulfuration protein SufE